MEVPRLEKVTPPESVQAVLARVGGWGCPVDHRFYLAPEKPTVEGHFAAAWAVVGPPDRELTMPKDIYVTLPPPTGEFSAGMGEPISPEAFFGDWVDIEGRGVYLGVAFYRYEQPSDSTLPEVGAYLMDAPLKGFYERFGDEADDEDEKEYAKAFLDPCYGLHEYSPGCLAALTGRNVAPKLTPQRLGVAFWEVCDGVFGDLKSIQVLRWPTLEHTRFYPGHEWWGNLFCTVYCPEKRWIVATVASSTD